MANLDLIKHLNEKYGKSSPIRNQKKLFAINDSFDPDNLKKALPSNIADLGVSYTRHFDLGLSADVCLMFIDICGFSTRLGHLDGDEIADFFDDYYDLVIPTIYKFGGEIDKVLGDGIICVFGPPFLSNEFEDNIKKANQCAKEIIKSTKGKEYSSKIAFHCGRIKYFKNKSGLYKEFTIIGKPLTELFRLESVSMDERINYYTDTEIREYYKQIFSRSSSSFGGQAEWSHSRHNLPSLKGISYTEFHTIKNNS